MNRVHSAASGSIPVEGASSVASMLDRAARALSDHFKCEWETMRDGDREMIRGYARAVLKAVGEPDERTVHFGSDALMADNATMADAFTAMIDAMLSEDTTYDR